MYNIKKYFSYFVLALGCMMFGLSANIGYIDAEPIARGGHGGGGGFHGGGDFHGGFDSGFHGGYHDNFNRGNWDHNYNNWNHPYYNNYYRNNWSGYGYGTGYAAPYYYYETPNYSQPYYQSGTSTDNIFTDPLRYDTTDTIRQDTNMRD